MSMPGRTIAQYLSKEVLSTMLIVTLVVVFIFMCNQFVRYLGFVASGKYAANMLFHLVLFQMPILVSLLLPLGLYVGILLGYGRLYADSEMTVLFSCGMSRQQLLAITMGIAVFVALVVGILVLWINPIVSEHRDRLMDLAESTTVFQTIMPGRFQSGMKGEQVFYVKSMSRDRTKMNDVFIAQQLNAESETPMSGMSRWNIVSAESGAEQVDKKTGEHYMVASQGYRYEGVPGQKKFRIVQYDTYGVRMGTPAFTGKNLGEEALSTWQLLQSPMNPEYMAELQWRFSLPISTLILALLGVPLCRVNPRQGRFAQLIPAVFIYIVYANMIFVSRSWLKDGTVSPWIGVWWIHLIVFVLAIWLIRRNPVVSLKSSLHLRWLGR